MVVGERGGVVNIHTQFPSISTEAKRKKEGITGNIVAACSRDDPGLGEAERAGGQTSVGGAVLLDQFPVTVSAHSTSLSSHPVWDLNLGQTAACVDTRHQDKDFPATPKLS